jgi:hypothetical protein
MRQEFIQFLINKGLTAKTETSRGTSDDYAFRIFHICNKIEFCGWENLALNINEILPEYEMGGSKFGIGKQSHTSFIQALRYFREFASLIKIPQASQKRWKLW